MRSNVPHAGAGRSDWAMRNWPVVESRLRRAAFSIEAAMPGFNVTLDLERVELARQLDHALGKIR